MVSRALRGQSERMGGSMARLLRFIYVGTGSGALCKGLCRVPRGRPPCFTDLTRVGRVGHRDKLGSRDTRLVGWCLQSWVGLCYCDAPSSPIGRHFVLGF